MNRVTARYRNTTSFCLFFAIIFLGFWELFELDKGVGT